MHAPYNAGDKATCRRLP